MNLVSNLSFLLFFWGLQQMEDLNPKPAKIIPLDLWPLLSLEALDATLRVEAALSKYLEAFCGVSMAQKTGSSSVVA